MNRQQLERILNAFEVRPDAYDLNGDADEAYCLAYGPDGWHVFYSERGLRTGDRVLDTEAAACDLLLEMVARDPLTRSLT